MVLALKPLEGTSPLEHREGRTHPPVVLVPSTQAWHGERL